MIAITIIQALFQLLTFLIIIDALLSFVLSPYQPFRVFLDRLVNPMLAPIRRIVPPLMGMDFSPVILILLLQGIQYLLVRVLS
jgi:YggT family protein